MAKKKQNSKIVMQQKRRRRQLLTLMRILRYGADSFIRNAWLSVAAAAIMTITLIILLGSMISKILLTDTISTLESKLSVSIYLKKNTKDSDVQKIMESIKGLKSVKDVSYRSPEEARKEFSTQNINDEKIRMALIESEDQFFGSLNVKTVDVRDTTELKNFVDKDELIQKNLDPNHEPTYQTDRKKTIDNIANSMSFIEKIGIVVGVIFAVIASLIIFNTIRMAIFNRREEIYMMKLIGANKSFIVGPFLVEAIICGVISAILATITCYSVVFLSKARLAAAGVTVDHLVTGLQRFSPLVLLAMILVGSIIGVLSSLVATRKYLKI